MSQDTMIAIISIVCLGLFVGIANYFKQFMDDGTTTKRGFGKFLGVVLTTTITSFIAFTIINHLFEMQLMTKLGISSAVAFLGIDKFIDYAERLMSIRNAGKKD